MQVLATVIQVAVRALLIHKMRSFLTMLGVVIGVGAVIALVAVGAGSQAAMVQQFEAMGVNLLSVRPNFEMQFSETGPRKDPNPLHNADVEALIKLATSLDYIAPQFETWAAVSYRGKTTETSINGVTADFAPARDWSVARGRFITAQDQASGAMVAVVSASVVKELFGTRIDPLGQTIRINRQNMRVVGVLKSKGESWGMDTDSIVFLPLRTAQIKLGGAGTTRVDAIYLKVDDPDRMKFAEAEVRSILRALHRTPSGQPDDFMVQNQADTIEEFSKWQQESTILLGSIAAISLLVGGIGIMNIMLVSVTERTREVGLRKAVGAKRRHILTQFLAEAAVLSVLGGLLGVGLGVGLAQLITPLFGGTPALVTPQSVALALGVSLAIGIFFGLYPANRAARLNPIDALRYE